LAVRDTLLRPLLAGRIEHEGQLVSRVDGEPIIDETTWLRVRAKIDGRRRGRPSSNQLLGSGIIVCGICGRPLSGRAGAEPVRGRYDCNKQRRGCGKINVSLTHVDAELRAMTIARLSDPRHAQAIAAVQSEVSDRLSAILREIDQIESLQRALSERLGRREMSLADFDNSYKYLQADLTSLVAGRDELKGLMPGDRVNVTTDVDVAREWDEAETVADQRAMLREAIGSDQVRILPAKRGGPVFNPNRVVLVARNEPFLNTL
jgi:site-specific DNA recombinase